jgi:hypothetical protein
MIKFFSENSMKLSETYLEPDDFAQWKKDGEYLFRESHFDDFSKGSEQSKIWQEESAWIIKNSWF